MLASIIQGHLQQLADPTVNQRTPLSMPEISWTFTYLLLITPNFFNFALNKYDPTNSFQDISL